MEKDNRGLTRRDFIKATGAGLAGAALLSGPMGSLANIAHASVTKPDLPVEKSPAGIPA